MMRNYSLLLLAIFVFVGCNSSDPEVANPYDNQTLGEEHDKVDADNKDIDPNTIQGIHAMIFKPTCANSGCHDGNFEPDFRSIESSYNSLVGQPIIKNDEMNPLTARVTPGNAATSMLVRRLEVDLNGNSGIMPIVVDPGSDWPDKKNEYIAQIKKWIDNGALDQHGNAPTSSNFPIQLRGIIARVNGTIVGRSGTYKSMNIPGGASQVEVWFAFEDDALSADKITGGKMDVSLIANEFDSTNFVDITYNSTPLKAVGYYGDEESFYHKAVISLSQWNSGDVLWLRSHISDGVNSSELPNDNSLFRAKEYATLKLQ